MFGSVGLPEIVMILVLALLIFGPKRLPEVGRTIGKGLSEFRRATTDIKRSVNAELSLEEDERPPTPRRPVQGVGRTADEASTSRELPGSAPEGTTPRSDAADGPGEADSSDSSESSTDSTSEDEPSEPVRTG